MNRCCDIDGNLDHYLDSGIFKGFLVIALVSIIGGVAFWQMYELFE